MLEVRDIIDNKTRFEFEKGLEYDETDLISMCITSVISFGT